MDQRGNGVGSKQGGRVSTSRGIPQLGLKTSKSGFPISQPDVPGRRSATGGSPFRRITAAPTSEAGPLTDRPTAATSVPAAKLKSEPRVISQAHLKSVQKAAKAFENFNLSKFGKGDVPANYVDPRQVHDRTAVQDVQRKLISDQLQKLSDRTTQNGGVTITFPVARFDEVKKALPGMSEQGGEVRLDDLLAYLSGRMNGTTFYSRGNPVMRRLTVAMQARSQARAIIERVKNRSRGKHGGSTS